MRTNITITDKTTGRQLTAQVEVDAYRFKVRDSIGPRLRSEHTAELRELAIAAYQFQQF